MRNTLYLCLSVFILATSCKKGGNDLDAETTSTVDLGLSEICYSRLLLLAKHVAPHSADFSNVGLYTCATVDSIVGDTVDFPTNGPVTVHLSFPDSGCVDVDMRLKSGPIDITYHDDLDNIGAIAEIHFAEYGTGIGSFRGQVNVARISSTSFDVSFVDCELYSGSYTIEYSGAAVVTMVEGNDTADPIDDAYTYTSELSGKDREGRDFTASTSTPISMRTDCAWNLEGFYSVDPADRSTRSMNYGNGTCNGTLVVIAEGQEFTISFP